MPCITLDTQVLTQHGWLRCDQVRIGDSTIGYNPATGRNEWTLITEVVYYENGEVWCIGNRSWQVKVTPNHPWWSDTEIRVAEAFNACPECGWTPRGQQHPSRGVQVHRQKMHHLPNSAETQYRGEFVRTDKLGSHHRIRLAAPAETNGTSDLSPCDVQALAWLQGDGCLQRARKDNGKSDAWDGVIFQSKLMQVAKLRTLLTSVEHSESVRYRNPHHLPQHVFRLRRSYVTDLVQRSGVIEHGPEAFILSLSSAQRAAWLEAMLDAEGHRQPGKKPTYAEFVRIAQIDGPLQDAIALAVYLEGYRPTFSRSSAGARGYKPSGLVGMAGPHVVPSMFQESQVLDRQPVWCVKTDLETWTARQGRYIFLTGDTIL